MKKEVASAPASAAAAIAVEVAGHDHESEVLKPESAADGRNDAEVLENGVGRGGSDNTGTGSTQRSSGALRRLLSADMPMRRVTTTALSDAHDSVSMQFLALTAAMLQKADTPRWGPEAQKRAFCNAYSGGMADMTSRKLSK